MDDMDEAPITGPDAGLVRYLKWLVSILAATMIVGLIILIALIVMRFNASRSVPLPSEITLPDGATPTAITRGLDWVGVVTDDGRILIYSMDGRELRREIVVSEED